MPKIIADEQIFHAVMTTIVERGYVGATTRQIADAAGVSEVTLFRKYGSKLELVKRAIAALIEQNDFEDALQYSGDIRADLLRVLRAYQGSVVIHGKFFLVLFSETSQNPELAAWINQPFALFQAMGNLLARYQADGVLKPENPLHSAASLLGPLIYLFMIDRANAVTDIPSMDLETHVTHFLTGRYQSI